MLRSKSAIWRGYTAIITFLVLSIVLIIDKQAIILIKLVLKYILTKIYVK